MTQHFLSLLDIPQDDLHQLIKDAISLKAEHQSGKLGDTLKNKVLAMVFEKSSTRTRVSFEVAMTQLGGSAIFLSPRDTQLGRGEPIEDTAKVLSRMADVLCVRTFEHEKIERFALNSRVPVINALTDAFHPCQLLADLMTYTEHRGSIEGKTVTWIGDGNNMCHSYMNAAIQFNFNLRICTPEGYEPSMEYWDTIPSQVAFVASPQEAVDQSDLIVTDVWASMGQESEQDNRNSIFAPLQVNDKLMGLAQPDALFMHCLPAHRGEEVTAEVIDGSQSVVWDEAENRLHAQKALLEYCLSH